MSKKFVVGESMQEGETAMVSRDGKIRPIRDGGYIETIEKCFKCIGPLIDLQEGYKEPFIHEDNCECDNCNLFNSARELYDELSERFGFDDQVKKENRKLN